MERPIHTVVNSVNKWFFILDEIEENKTAILPFGCYYMMFVLH